MMIFGTLKVKFRIGVILLFLLAGSQSLYSQDVMAADTTAGDSTSNAGYDDIKVAGGVNAVESELKVDDVQKKVWFDVNYSDNILKGYYRTKKKIKVRANLAIGSDYCLMSQMASYSFSKKNAASGVYRFYGTWIFFETEGGYESSLIFKLENRHKIGTSNTPRQLGYQTGSALSTATFNDFQWGLTNFYIKQIIAKNKATISVGILNSINWFNLYPLLNSYRYFINEAHFANPTIATPGQGMGITALLPITSNFYVSAGVHDANGDPNSFIIDNVKSLFNKGELFYWIEGGWNQGRSIVGGETVHIGYWHNDKQSELGIEKSEGLFFSASRKFGKYTPFIRGGFSDGNAALLRKMISGGVSIKAYRSDLVGIGLSWGAPTDRAGREQYGLECFYSFQLTQHLNLTPDFQFTLNPAFNSSQDFVAVFTGIRLRFVL